MSDISDPYGALDRRRTDPLIEMIAHKVGRMEESMDKLTDAITKLAVVEERQASDRQALERVSNSIAKAEEKLSGAIIKLDERLDKLEAAAPETSKTNARVESAVWAAAAAAVSIAANKLGML